MNFNKLLDEKIDMCFVFQGQYLDIMFNEENKTWSAQYGNSWDAGYFRFICKDLPTCEDAFNAAKKELKFKGSFEELSKLNEDSTTTPILEKE